MDITVCVMLPPRGASDYTTSAHSKWRVLEPVSVSLKGDTAQEITALRTGYIHVINVPMQPDWAGLSDEETVKVIASSICAVGTTTKKAWAGRSSMLPAPLRTDLLVDRQITLTWGQFKAFLQNDVRPFTEGDL